VEVSTTFSGGGESNRVWINERPLEEWLGAEVGRSACRCACGKHEGRALYLNGRRYEGLPEELLFKAALIAAAKLLGPKDDCRRRDRAACRPPVLLN